LDSMSRYSEAEAALRDGLERMPESLFLNRALAIHLWEITKQAGPALTAIDHYISSYLNQSPDRDTEDERNNRVEAISLRGRLLIAVDRIPEALETLKSIIKLLPPFSPVLGHLFDYELVSDLLRAGTRDEPLRDFINLIKEPRFLVNGITEDQFEETKRYLN